MRLLSVVLFLGSLGAHNALAASKLVDLQGRYLVQGNGYECPAVLTFQIGESEDELVMNAEDLGRVWMLDRFIEGKKIIGPNTWKKVSISIRSQRSTIKSEFYNKACYPAGSDSSEADTLDNCKTINTKTNLHFDHKSNTLSYDYSRRTNGRFGAEYNCDYLLDTVEN